MLKPFPVDGYAYTVRLQCEKDKRKLFWRLSNTCWLIRLFQVSGDEEYVGVRVVDGLLVNVWHSNNLPGYLAQRREQ